MNRHACTIIYSMYRVDAIHTPIRLRAGYPTLLQWRGRYDFPRLKTSRVLPYTSVLVIESFLTRSMLFLKCINTLYTVIFHLHNIKNAFLVNHSLFFVVSSDVLNFHGHSQCPCINVARHSVLHYDRIAHVNTRQVIVHGLNT